MTAVIVTLTGFALLVLSAGFVDWRLGVAVAGVLCVVTGLLVDFEENK